MGQKVHPYGFRLGIIREARSKWFAEGKRFRELLIEDIKLRRFILERTKNASVADVLIERTDDTIIFTIVTAKPGVIIGRGGRDVDLLRQELEQRTGMRVRVNVEEARDPDLNAQLVADNIARQIERRVSYRRAMRQAVDRAMKLGAKGIRVTVSGRLGGAEIARKETIGPEGRVPLHTLRADIDYGFAEAKTGYGHIGVKVWIYRGDILPPRKEKIEVEQEAEEALVAEAPVPATVEEPRVEAAPVGAPPAMPVTGGLAAAPAQEEHIELPSPEEDALLSALAEGVEDENEEWTSDVDATEDEISEGATGPDEGDSESG